MLCTVISGKSRCGDAQQELGSIIKEEAVLGIMPLHDT